MGLVDCGARLERARVVRRSGRLGDSVAEWSAANVEPRGWTTVGRREPMDRDARGEGRELHDRDVARTGAIPTGEGADQREADERAADASGFGRAGTPGGGHRQSEDSGRVADGTIRADDFGKSGTRDVSLPAEGSRTTSDGDAAKGVAVRRLTAGEL